ncbi:MAG: hypothetical protein HYZ79_04925, partial [Candidatus Melainabacteria bacterium]|nr:hypothetical protein [Candidatus Melainabacteria bacterium]
HDVQLGINTPKSNSGISPNSPLFNSFATQRLIDILSGNQTTVDIDNEGELVGVRSTFTNNDQFDKARDKTEIDQHKGIFDKFSNEFAKYYSTNNETQAVGTFFSKLKGDDLLYALDLVALNYVKLIVDKGLTPRQAYDQVRGLTQMAPVDVGNWTFDLFAQRQWDQKIEATPARKYELLAQVKEINRKRLSDNRIKLTQAEPEKLTATSYDTFLKTLKDAAEKISRDVVYKGKSFNQSFWQNFNTSDIHPSLLTSLSSIYNSLSQQYNQSDISSSPYKATLQRSIVDSIMNVANRMLHFGIVQTKFQENNPLYSLDRANHTEQEIRAYDQRIYEQQFAYEMQSKIFNATRGESDKDRNLFTSKFLNITRTPQINHLRENNIWEYNDLMGRYLSIATGKLKRNGIDEAVKYLDSIANSAKTGNVPLLKQPTIPKATHGIYGVITHEGTPYGRDIAIANAINGTLNSGGYKWVYNSSKKKWENIWVDQNNTTQYGNYRSDVYYYERQQAAKNNEVWIEPTNFSPNESAFHALLNNNAVKKLKQGNSQFYNSFVAHNLNTYTQLLRNNPSEARKFLQDLTRDVENGNVYFASITYQNKDGIPKPIVNKDFKFDERYYTTQDLRDKK